MLRTEYVRNLNCNYERILLDKKPEENRYQYCIVGRGGIRGLLPCSLRYINGKAYLYYDISSTQNVAQLYGDRRIDRSWMKDFLWSMRQIREELGRFLLDDENLLWYPEQIFQDLEKNEFFFLYIPYSEEEGGFRQLLDYLVEHIDYDDEGLVECVYKMHEQYELLGEVYLKEQIFLDGELPDRLPEETVKAPSSVVQREEGVSAERARGEAQDIPVIQKEETEAEKDAGNTEEEKKGIRYLFDKKKKKQKEERLRLQDQTRQLMAEYAVCEEADYEREEMGKTVLMEESASGEEPPCLVTLQGKHMAELTAQSLVIGKKKEEADCLLEDMSVSRIHARITRENGDYYLEDLNSTNGTYKNGLRLQPYEKRRLEKEDEIRLGKVILVFR